MAYWDSLQRLTHDVRAWNAWRQQHPDVGIDLRGASLSKAHLAEADLRHVNLTGAILSDADLTGAILSDADLSKADLRRADLRKALLSAADLSKVDLRTVDLSGADLRKVDLRGADLRRAHLRQADLSEAILCGVDFRLANLIETNCNGAMLTDARLWESQRAGWSIQGVQCQAASWDRDGRERTRYSPGEFERLYTDHTTIVLHYPGGLSPLELATLPALLQRMEAAHPGCVLHLRSVQAEAGGATVTVVMDDGGGQTRDELQDQAQHLQAAQRDALAHAAMRPGIEHHWSQLTDAVFPILVEHA